MPPPLADDVSDEGDPFTTGAAFETGGGTLGTDCSAALFCWGFTSSPEGPDEAWVSLAECTATPAAVPAAIDSAALLRNFLYSFDDAFSFIRKICLGVEDDVGALTLKDLLDRVELKEELDLNDAELLARATCGRTGTAFRATIPNAVA
ncbi:hypothetical protein AA11825_1527 [Acetobacter pomorum DSM 11825]|nr:hypothetical protein AA11825_1527 [Acetobacter pomorum DSM 11825]